MKERWRQIEKKKNEKKKKTQKTEMYFFLQIKIFFCLSRSGIIL